MSDQATAAAAEAPAPSLRARPGEVPEVIVDYGDASAGAVVTRLIAWSNIGLLLALIVNNALTFWVGWPGAGVENGALGALQLGLYAVSVIAAFAYVVMTSRRALRLDGRALTRANMFFIRACFWAVVLVGLGDAIISVLRVEEQLEGAIALFGITAFTGGTAEELAGALGRANFRGPYVHVPLMLLGVLFACFTRTLGFIWLALLVVAAELLIVLGRFVFSYEQSFMGDLVRFWYASLFLFASAYTLVEEGHVRVDVLYAGFADTTRGVINAVGSVVLGMSLCWVVLIIGMSSASGTINGPLLSFEISQAGFGMYTKYMLAAYLAVFAISMLVQFAAYMLEGVADWRGDPGKYRPTSSDAH